MLRVHSTQVAQVQELLQNEGIVRISGYVNGMFSGHHSWRVRI